MLLRTLIMIVFVTSAMAAVSSQVSHPKTEGVPQTPIQVYQIAKANLGHKQSCKSFKELADDPKFELNQLALLRYAENCDSKISWDEVYKKVTRPTLKPFVFRAHYDSEINHKRFGNAYRIYHENRKNIEVNDRDFATMAVAALKTKLSKEEKKRLRAELQGRAPRFIPNPKKAEYRKVARDYRNQRQFEKALKYYRLVINDPSMSYSERWRAFRGARITYKFERWSRMQKYIKASKQWAEFLRKVYKKTPQLTKMHHDANIDYIRTLWTEKGQKQALPPLKKLEKEMKGRYSLQMVFWLKGRMAEERKEYKEAVRWLSRATNERAITLRDQDRALWSLAWNQRRIGQYKESQFALEKLKKSKELTFFSKTKYLYWQAENLESMGKKKEAEEAFERLADLDRYGFYGALCYRKLNVPFPTPPKKDIDEKDLLEFFEKTDRQFVRALVDVEEYEISEAFTLEKVKYKNKWSTSKWVDYLNLLQFTGAYKSFFIRYHSLPPKKQLAIEEEHPYLLFPQPYKKQVVSSSRDTKVSPALIYSIMKQESGFDARARSHADAFGLLQLIPQVAKRAAQRMPSVDYDEPYDLYRPDVIIPLGANSLHDLFTRFDSNFILSVASYNASEHAVRGWIKSRYQGDPIKFIEDIPYEETKGYVKLVMRNYITYNRFENKEGPFMFPEICLSGLDLFKSR